MSKDILDVHFGPNWHLPEPRKTDGRVALGTILLYTQPAVPETNLHPYSSADDLIVEDWQDQGMPE